MIIQQDNLLLEDEFLIALSEQKERELYARITALDIKDNPIEQIEGKVTGGSINIDGNSSVRRTCNLTLVKDQININDYYWGIKTKFKLEIGLRNKLIGNFSAKNNSYPEIVWFLQGYYLISSFNTSLSTSGYTISISGKDKMCLLNGDLGGQLPSSIDFGTEEVETFNMEQISFNILPYYSNELMNKGYYFKPNTTENNNIDNVNINNPLYCFVQSDNGIYYKENDYYKKIPSNTTFSGRKYTVYKKVQNPSDIFESITLNSNSYEPNTYYYLNKTNTDYYILDQAPNFQSGKTYYKLKFLFRQYVDITKTKLPLIKIIREAIHVYANEPYQNIIINDLDIYGLEQLTYKGDTPLYFLYDMDNTHSFSEVHFTDLRDPKEYEEPTFVCLSANDLNIDNGDIYTDDKNNHYKVMKIEFGQDVGYRLTDLVYPGDLICNIGETVTSVLDKIKTILGEFEYFYNIDGKFVFQKKKNYIQTYWSQIVTTPEGSYAVDANSTSKYSFNFKENQLISAIQNAPILINLRNDYSIWGKRKTASNADRSIHIRYAIDKKPLRYRNLKGEIYATDEYPNENNEEVIIRDWRELIYQMALDYFGGQGCSENLPYGNLTNPENFLSTVGTNNPKYYPTGKTGYEQYYTDLYGFWRELYNPDYQPTPDYSLGYYEKLQDSETGREYDSWHPPEIKDFNVDYYFTEYDFNYHDNSDVNYYQNYVKLKKYNCKNNSSLNNRKYWNINVFEYPESLNFWFDFLDSDTELAQFAVPQIGDRSKTVSETSVNGAIIYNTIPNLIFYKSETSEVNPYINELNSGYTLIQLPEAYEQYFVISSRGISLKEKLDELLYQHSYCIENITLTSIPIYYLEPNTLISITDKNTSIEGEYIINKITIPLAYNGTMQISAVKVPPRIL